MTRSEIMRRIGSSGNASTEAKFAKALGMVRAEGWLHQISVCGIKADFIFPFARLAIFTDGCIWHGCSMHASPRKLRGAWRRKIEGNMTRDRSQEIRLRAQGWRVMRIWEHELKTDGAAIVQAMQARVLARWLASCRRSERVGHGI